jgi:hypothetical protein
MATTKRQQRQHRSPRSLYPPEHARRVAEAEARDPYSLDDTLDAIGPSLLMGGPPPTPEEIAAARAKAIERGWLPREHPAHPDPVKPHAPRWC